MIDLNTVMIISLVVLAIVSLCLFIVLIPIALQFIRTLNSFQHLIDMINSDLKPTLGEIKAGVSNIRSSIQKCTEPTKTILQEVNIKAVSTLHGFLTGLRTYLMSCKDIKASYNGNENLELGIKEIKG